MFGKPAGLADNCWPALALSLGPCAFEATEFLVGSGGKALFPFENMFGLVQPIDIKPANSKPVQALVVKVFIRELPVDGHADASCTGAVSP